MMRTLSGLIFVLGQRVSASRNDLELDKPRLAPRRRARRFPWTSRLRLQRQFIIDGEAVLLVCHGNSDFDGLHSGKHDGEMRLCAFDILSMPFGVRFSRDLRS